MKTLYDMLGVRRGADNETVKKAFRKAVKLHHPDLHAGDPDSSSRFRQIVTANAILRDAEQRAAYDRLLDRERRRIRSKWTCIIISDAVAVVLLGVVLVGGYKLVAPVPATSTMTDEAEPGRGRALGGIATIGSAARSGTMGQGGSRDGSGEAADRVIEPNAAAPAANDGVAPVIAGPGAGRDVVSNDAAFDADKDAAPGPREIATIESKARTDSTGAGEPLGAPMDVSGTAIEPAAAAPAMDGGAAQVVASLVPAAGVISHDAKFHRERGTAAYRNGEFNKAIADLDRAIGLDPNDARAYNIRGNAWDYAGAPDRALADYDAAIRIDPDNPAIFRDRGIMWRREGDLDRALVDLDRAIRFSFSDASIYSDRGLIWYAKGRHNRAIADFNQALRINPDFSAAYIDRGITLHRGSNFDPAFADVDQTIRIDPNIFDVARRGN